ncbi:MAG: family 16 glycosylhydrolase [Clostridium sp.]|nr:family 16 glycosylhydrolase [Prevotella sp.]MCM1429087.1 family 16 glycosylhydrolase [Clostridium sp.]MCM1475383.1 family 16 glycosylhydrolase [Muribaculaceae bacterium]
MRLLNSSILLLCMATAPGIYAANPQIGSGETGGYKLVWQDLFDEGTINPLRWNIEVNGSGGGNNELQYYTNREENLRVGDDGEGNSCLIITARREKYKNKEFTSGRLNTMNFVTFTHGKIEASIKLPTTNAGLWPAFWMMGNDYSQVGWPKCGETDILEMGHSDGMRAGTSDRYFNGAAHWGQGWPNASHAMNATKNYSLQDGQFHLYTLIWDENSYKMYVDLDKMPVQTPYFRMDITPNDPGNEWSAGNYFHKDNFIIFNLAIGGNFPGIHSAESITALNDENGQQASMYVNYVKVYQLEDNASNTFFSAIPSDNLSVGSESSVSAISIEHPLSIDNADNTVRSLHPADIEVFNMGGILVAGISASTSLDISGLPAGIYFARCEGHSLKFVKK